MSILADYEKAKEYILSIPKFTTKHEMAQTRAFYEFLGSPCEKKNIIHVAGTNGKGSVCAYLRNILECAGFTTGVFVSPHLVSVRERFLFDGEMVSREEFVASYNAVLESSAEFAKTECPGYHPSYFEFLFFMFLMLDKTCGADYLILETGLGGLLDATNVMPRKDLCIITEIGLDHMEYLGETREEIATQKAGILRSHTPVVFAADRKEVAKVIENAAKKCDAPTYSVKKCDYKFGEFRDKGIDFSLHSVYDSFTDLALSTFALYQMENATLAVTGIRRLPNAERFTEKVIREGLLRTKWAGRMEEIAPDIYVDGAHNEDGIAAFLSSVAAMPTKDNVLIFAVVNDKNYSQMAAMIGKSHLFQTIYLTVTGGYRATDIQSLNEALRKEYDGDCILKESAEQAFLDAMKVRREGERILVAGSLYLVGQIKALVGGNSDD